MVWGLGSGAMLSGTLAPVAWGHEFASGLQNWTGPREPACGSAPPQDLASPTSFLPLSLLFGLPEARQPPSCCLSKDAGRSLVLSPCNLLCLDLLHPLPSLCGSIPHFLQRPSFLEGWQCQSFASWLHTACIFLISSSDFGFTFPSPCWCLTEQHLFTFGDGILLSPSVAQMGLQSGILLPAFVAEYLSLMHYFLTASFSCISVNFLRAKTLFYALVYVQQLKLKI